MIGDVGNDAIHAKDGDDFVRASLGNDVLRGGEGFDTLVVPADYTYRGESDAWETYAVGLAGIVRYRGIESVVAKK